MKTNKIFTYSIYHIYTGYKKFLAENISKQWVFFLSNLIKPRAATE